MSPPPGYIQDNGIRIKPINRERLNKILTLTSASYGNLTKERKFEITRLALDMQNVLTFNSTQTQSMETYPMNDISIAVPSQHALM